MKKILIVIALISSITQSEALPLWSLESQYTNKYLEGKIGYEICNVDYYTVSFDPQSYFPYPTHPIFINYPIATNGFAFASTGTERHFCTGYDNPSSNIISISTYEFKVLEGITNDIIIEWQWDTEYRVETYVSNGYVNLTNGWYAEGTNLQIVATPYTNFAFNHWSSTPLTDRTTTNNFSTNATINISVTNPVIYTAYFTLITNYYLGVSASSNGSVSLAHNGFEINSLHPTNTSGDICAWADEPLYEFSHWSGDISISETNHNPASVYMNQNRYIVAHFKRSAPMPPLIMLSNTNNIQIKWEGILNREYTIQASTNLSNWTNLIMVVGNNDMKSYTDDRGLDKSFYRLSVY